MAGRPRDRRSYNWGMIACTASRWLAMLCWRAAHGFWQPRLGPPRRIAPPERTDTLRFGADDSDRIARHWNTKSRSDRSGREMVEIAPKPDLACLFSSVRTPLASMGRLPSTRCEPTSLLAWAPSPGISWCWWPQAPGNCRQVLGGIDRFGRIYWSRW